MSRYATQIRKRFDRQLFKNPQHLATDITITSTELAASSDGGFTPGAESEVDKGTVKGIPYNNEVANLFKTAFGQADLGDGTVVLRFDAPVGATDILSWSGKSYRVEQVRDYTLGNDVVVRVAQVNEHTA